MLKPAQLYAEELTKKFLEITYNDKYKFYNSGWMNKYVPSEDTWNMHEFVCIYRYEVIGYISYDINQRSQNITNVRIINFSNEKFAFGIDVRNVIKDIFLKYKFNKINFCCYTANPAMLMYERFIKKFGGRVVGVYEKESRLSDGLYYDLKAYELLNNMQTFGLLEHQRLSRKMKKKYKEE